MIVVPFFRSLTQSVALPDPAGQDVLTSGPVLGFLAVLALTLLILIVRQRRPHGPKGQWILIDGSNVLHWKNNTPDLVPLLQVIRLLGQQGYAPGIVFDANVGYKLRKRYMNEAALGRVLNLPQDRVFVVPKGSQADAYLLQMAHELQVSIVTNDRFRDWADYHPEVAEAGMLIRGSVRQGAVQLMGLERARRRTNKAA